MGKVIFYESREEMLRRSSKECNTCGRTNCEGGAECTAHAEMRP